jgi:nucleotide-binding universal stress UspA family protein
MRKVIAALDNSLAATPVLATALALGRMLGAAVEPVHVQTNDDRVARGAAEAAGLTLRTLRGSVVDRLSEVGEREDTAALVLGARGTPLGRRPLGSTALAVAGSLPKPIVIVPPEAKCEPVFRRALVPMEAAVSPALTPRAIVELAEGAELDVVVLHVHEEDSLPLFTDQPQHEQAAWAREFLRRYCPWGISVVRLEVRVGRSEELVPLVAEQTEADLIALGWSQQLEPGRAPVVRGTLERARTPVMLVPVEGADRPFASHQPGGSQPAARPS